MSVELIDIEHFDWRGYNTPSVFDSEAFIRLNAAKVRRVVVAEGDGLAQILGETDGGIFRAPFSAPFSMPLRGENADYRAFAQQLFAACRGRLELTPAPVFHRDVPAWTAALDSLPLVRTDDFNYHIPVERLAETQAYMSKMARRNLRRAMSVGFELRMTRDIEGVYGFLAEHHRALGYHMAMTCQGVCDTAAILPVDFFEVMLDCRRAAAAIFYRVAPGIVQLINWGDALDLRGYRTSSFMAHAIFAYYAALGDINIIDLGPASTDGVRNEPLIAFKLGLGAVETCKPTYRG